MRCNRTAVAFHSKTQCAAPKTATVTYFRQTNEFIAVCGSWKILPVLWFSLLFSDQSLGSAKQDGGPAFWVQNINLKAPPETYSRQNDETITVFGGWKSPRFDEFSLLSINTVVTVRIKSWGMLPAVRWLASFRRGLSRVLREFDVWEGLFHGLGTPAASLHAGLPASGMTRLAI